MFPIALPVVLLFAVATSQIFGGISCCCLGRTPFAEMLTVNNATATEIAPQHEFFSVTQKRKTGKCPKCSVRKSSPAASEQTSSNKLHHYRAKVCEGGQCGCIKPVVNASTPSDPPPLNHDSHVWVSSVLDVKPEREVVAHISPRFEVPIRFGGRSWQSIACVWKN